MVEPCTHMHMHTQVIMVQKEKYSKLGNDFCRRISLSCTELLEGVHQEC